MSSQLGIDVGGTFTDLLLLDNSTGVLRQVKMPTTPNDPANAIAAGIEKLQQQDPNALRDCTVYHAGDFIEQTLTRQQAKPVGLLVTAGFENLMASPEAIPGYGQETAVRRTPLAALCTVRGIQSRLNASGEVTADIDEEQATACISDLLRAGVSSIVVAMLHARANPLHERRLREMIEAQDGTVEILLSSEQPTGTDTAQRAQIAVVNAYTRPGLRGYLERLQTQLNTSKLFIRTCRWRTGLRRAGGALAGADAARWRCLRHQRYRSGGRTNRLP